MKLGKPNNEKTPWFYIGHVSLKQAWDEVRTFVFVWAIFVLIGWAISWLTNKIGFGKDGFFAQNIPGWAWYPIGFAILTWLFRGQTFQIAFPQTVKQWLLVNVLVVLTVIISTNASELVSIAWFWGMMCLIGLFNNLSQAGKANYDEKVQRSDD